MQSTTGADIDLERKFAKVLATPASFAFFVAVHDLVEQLEASPIPVRLIAPAKHAQLKQIHRGVEDIITPSKEDLGHERHMVIQDLLRIRNNDFSEGNPIWKKREVVRNYARDLQAAILKDQKKATEI